VRELSSVVGPLGSLARRLTAQIGQGHKKDLLRLWDKHEKNFDRIHLVTLLHRCATLGVTDRWVKEVVTSLGVVVGQSEARRRGARADSKLGPMSPRELANALWALGKLQLSDTAKLVEGLRERLQPQLRKCKAQELSNAAWASARLALADERYLDALGLSCSRSIHDMSSQHLANVSWAFGTLGSVQVVWFSALAKVLLAGSAQELPPRHLVNILWGHAKVGVRHAVMFGHLGDTVARREDFDDWSDKDFAGVVWAFASLDVPHRALFLRIAQEVRSRLKDFGNQELQNLAWAFSKSDLWRSDGVLEGDNTLLALSTVPRSRRRAEEVGVEVTSSRPLVVVACSHAEFASASEQASFAEGDVVFCDLGDAAFQSAITAVSDAEFLGAHTAVIYCDALNTFLSSAEVLDPVDL